MSPNTTRGTIRKSPVPGEPHPLILVEWVDAGTVGSDWMTRDEVIAACVGEKFLNRSVGWVVYEDKSLLILSATTHAGNEDTGFDQVTRIPKSLVKSRKVLRS